MSLTRNLLDRKLFDRLKGKLVMFATTASMSMLSFTESLLTFDNQPVKVTAYFLYVVCCRAFKLVVSILIGKSTPSDILFGNNLCKLNFLRAYFLINNSMPLSVSCQNILQRSWISCFGVTPRLDWFDQAYTTNTWLHFTKMVMNMHSWNYRGRTRFEGIDLRADCVCHTLHIYQGERVVKW